METEEILESRYRFFVEKGSDLAVQQDKTLITLFTAIIGGLLAFIGYSDVGFWSATFLALAVLCAVLGLSFTLLHMAFSAMVMGLYAAKFGGDENVPHLATKSEPTGHALTRTRAYAQLSYVGELGSLIWSALFAGLAVTAVLWDVLGVFGVLCVIGFASALTYVSYRPLIWVHRRCRIAIETQQGMAWANDPMQDTRDNEPAPS